MKNNFLQIYLQENLKNVKKRVGQKCSFLSFESYRDLLFFKAYMKNDRGGKDRVRIKINSALEDITPKEFEDLYNMLTSENYASRETV